MNELIASLEQLSEDSRLSKTFSSSELCDLTFWVLRIKKGKSSEYRLLYGWILEHTFKKSDQWSTYTVFNKKKLGGSDFSMYRISYQQSGRKIFDLVKQLCMGISLESACQQLNIVQPKEHKEFRFAKTSQKALELFLVRPTVFIKHASNYRDRSEELKPISSPNELAPAFLGSLVRLKKTEIFHVAEGLQSSQIDELSKLCLQKIAEETGLDFCGVDSKRLGNLEWLNFPSADCYEKPKVKIDFDSQSNTAYVTVLEDKFAPGTRVIIRCCLFDGCEVCVDQLKELSVGKQSLFANFVSQQKVTKFTITIWVKGAEEEVGNIWYENSGVFFSINLEVGVRGLTGNLSSEWLEDEQLKNTNSRKINQRVEKVQGIEQIHHEPICAIKKYDRPPWILEGEQSYALVSRLFSSSKSLFIRNGWYEKDFGKLIFLEWLQSITSNSNISEVLIIDPYFDKSGITELIARVTAAQTKYRVITNTQVSEKGEPERALNLKQACQSVQMNQILAGLKFELLDLRSKEGPKNQLFHDRYILYYNLNGEIAGGYHLSNSIRGATKRHPLLITEISYDISREVDEYISEKLEDKSYIVVQLFLSPKKPSQKKSIQDEKVSELSKLLLSKLLKDKGILSLDREGWTIYIKKNSDLSLKGGFFEFKDINSVKTKGYLRQLTHSLINDTPEEFTRTWIGLCTWLNQIIDGYQYRTTIAAIGGHQLSTQLLNALLYRFPNGQKLISSLDAKAHRIALMLGNAIQLDFIAAVDESNRLLMYQDWEILSSSAYGNGIRCATELLAFTEPRKLTDTVYELHLKLLPASEKAQTTLPLLFTISFILQQIIIDVGGIFELEDVRQNELLKAMLKSKIPILRAISACVVVQRAGHSAKLSKVFSILSTLGKTEQLYMLADCSSALRIKGSLSQTSDDNPTESKKQLEIFSKMRECCPQELPNNDLRRILSRLSGKSAGSYSADITRDFLVPLINDEITSMKWVADYWLSLTDSRLNSLIDKEEQKESDSIFDCQCEWALIHVVSWSIVHSDATQQALQIANLTKIKKSAQRIVFEPFLKTRNYKRWSKASTCLLWLMLLHVVLLEQSLDMDGAGSIQLFQPSEPFDKLLDKTFEEHSTQMKEWLWEKISSTVNPSQNE